MRTRISFDMLLGMIFRLYSEIFVEIHALFLEILRFEFVTLFVKHPVQPSTFSLLPKAYHLQPQTTTYNLPPRRQGGSDKLYSFLEFKFLESDRPSSSPVELPGTMPSMKFCIEWCRDQGLLTRA